jgi:hypothetical protein
VRNTVGGGARGSVCGFEGLRRKYTRKAKRERRIRLMGVAMDALDCMLAQSI